MLQCLVKTWQTKYTVIETKKKKIRKFATQTQFCAYLTLHIRVVSRDSIFCSIVVSLQACALEGVCVGARVRQS